MVAGPVPPVATWGRSCTVPALPSPPGSPGALGLEHAPMCSSETSSSVVVTPLQLGQQALDVTIAE